MPAERIDVSTPNLGYGSDRCHDAAGSVRKAAEQLGDAPSAGIFGGHAQAQQFHNALDAAHRGHQDDLHGHHTALTDIAGNAGTAKLMFTGTDEAGADGLDSAAAAFDG
ncbi:hypothetical protein BA059_14225 [Mycolicibacterium sp. (ex Dasyatis americana)]|nr:hypothetical protein BA059_14225 [Mycolicibacterium sp. (ex Dasyatis americana)]